MTPVEALRAVKDVIDLLKENDEYDVANKLEEAVVVLISTAAHRGEEGVFEGSTDHVPHGE